jgi:hypothetical protein
VVNCFKTIAERDCTTNKDSDILVSTILQDDDSKGKPADSGLQIALPLTHAEAPQPFIDPNDNKKLIRSTLPKRPPNPENIVVQEETDEGQAKAKTKAKSNTQGKTKEPLSGESDRLNRERRPEKSESKVGNEKLQQAYKERVLEAKK